MADTALCSLLFYLYTLCVNKEELASTPNLARYFTAFVSFKSAQTVLGSFKFHTGAALTPAFTAKPQAEKAQGGDKKGKGEKKEKKEEKPKSDKEEKERLRQEALEAELKLHDTKVKSWLEMECKFDFEDFKRVYCNAQPGQFKPVFDELWKNYDESQVSFFYLR